MFLQRDVLCAVLLRISVPPNGLAQTVPNAAQGLLHEPTQFLAQFSLELIGRASDAYSFSLDKAIPLTQLKL